MTSLEDEILAIQNMTDAAKILQKRSARKSAITRICTQTNAITSASLAAANAREVEKKLSDAKRSVALYAALQERYEECIATDSTYDAEAAAGADANEANEQLVEKLEAFHDQVNLFIDGNIILSRLDKLNSVDSIASVVYQKEFQLLKDKSAAFERRAVIYPTATELNHLKTRIDTLTAAIMEKSATKEREAAAASRPSTPTPLPKSSHSPLAHLTLELPKFHGSPLEWKSFKERLDSLMKEHGTALSESDRCNQLLKCMAAAEPRAIVEAVAKGKDGYSKACQALEDAYGRVNIIYPHYVRKLLKPDSYTYDRTSLRRMRETFEASMNGMESCAVTTLDQFIAAILVDRFDDRMRMEWTAHYAGKDAFPKAQELIDFFKGREFGMLDAQGSVAKSATKPAAVKKSLTSGARPHTSSHRTVNHVSPVTTGHFQCPVCKKEGHPISRCQTFLSWTPEQRKKAAREHHHCFNCLSHAHLMKECNSAFSCRLCQGRHHSLLHQDNSHTSTTASSRPDTPPATPPPSNGSVVHHVSVTECGDVVETLEASGGAAVLHINTSPTALLATALARVRGSSRELVCRLLLDPGSDLTLITEQIAAMLKLPRQKGHQPFSTLGGTMVSREFVICNITSVKTDLSQETLQVKAWVLPRLGYQQPPDNVTELKQSPCLQGKLPLADPELGGRLDMLLGASDFVRCLQGTLCIPKNPSLLPIPSIFGWILMGTAPTASKSAQVLRVNATNQDLDDVLQKLFEMDQDVPVENPDWTVAEQSAVDQFYQTFAIMPDGRYSCSLPRCDKPPQLGESRKVAERRFYANEKKLTRAGQLEEFQQAMREYDTLGHAEQVPAADLTKPPSHHCYLPVHGVAKASSTTTKMRPVFDASAKTSTGASLNDTMLKGPNLYPALTSILTKFRTHTIAMSSDISKMFREIALNPTEHDLHRFLMRDSQGVVRDYRMVRLTFGVRASPFIATQVLREHARRHLESHPRAAATILNCFYVDDCLTGTATPEDGIMLREELCQLCSLLCMTLRKFRSNSQQLRDSIPPHLREDSDLHIQDPQEATKTLGIHWHLENDAFYVATPTIEPDNLPVPTKRIIASLSAQVYDVMGFFAPVVIIPRILMQLLWKAKIDWDEEVPADIATEWSSWIASLAKISTHPIPRRLAPIDLPILRRQIHAFSDASERAYGTVIYLRTTYINMDVTVTLIMAKSRVAPLNESRMPRLELRAAHLCTKLLHTVSTDLDLPASQAYCWSDSRIVLSWIRYPPDKLKMFAANRVQAILKVTTPDQWHYVETKVNPADLPSRGANAEDIVISDFWWHGPPWLRLPPTQWPVLENITPTDDTSELKTAVHHVKAAVITPEFCTKFSSFRMLVAVVAWMFRFLRNSNRKKFDNFPHLTTKHLTMMEIQKAEKVLLRLTQQQTFSDVLESIETNKPLPTSHTFSGYNVFTDNCGLLWIAGRVRSGAAGEIARKYIPLSAKSELVQLFLKYQHQKMNHAGPATVMAVLAETYHILRLQKVIKAISRKCVTCRKAYGKTYNQQMGMLPAERTSGAAAFTYTGVDFTGPFEIRESELRKARKLKAYAAVFVCLSTRAVDIQACSSLSTDAFIGALTRFCNEHGAPAVMFSDNGSNFIGTKNEIKDIRLLLNRPETESQLNQLSVRRGMEWRFIAPRAPHQGGLWESAVRAMKVVLRKLHIAKPITFEQLSTLLKEAQAILNSRPLLPFNSTDPDVGALTAGHFVIGRPILAPPLAPADTETKPNLLNLWNLTRKLMADLWQQWKPRYLQSLSARHQWLRPTRNFCIDDIVLVKDEMINSRTWPMARVVDVRPGSDGKVRNVTIRCQGKEYKRTTNRLVLLQESSSPDEMATSVKDSAPQAGEDVQVI